MATGDLVGDQSGPRTHLTHCRGVRPANCDLLPGWPGARPLHTPSLHSYPQSLRPATKPKGTLPSLPQHTGRITGHSAAARPRPKAVLRPTISRRSDVRTWTCVPNPINNTHSPSPLHCSLHDHSQPKAGQYEKNKHHLSPVPPTPHLGCPQLPHAKHLASLRPCQVRSAASPGCAGGCHGPPECRTHQDLGKETTTPTTTNTQK